VPGFFLLDLKEYNNMGQFFNETAENEDLSHPWQIFVVSPGLVVLQVREKYYGQDKITFMPCEV